MRDPERIDVFCDKLKEYWHKVPDWRFGQLVSNIFGQSDTNQFYCEDDYTMKLFERFFDRKT